jgi:hypothetical protein
MGIGGDMGRRSLQSIGKGRSGSHTQHIEKADSSTSEQVQFEQRSSVQFEQK